ncbi:FecCD family ABC transporter permease [Streptomyces pinistramenti]|uniref:FecCD family ABC transporter permease n=1 Tax=Streptomyces pinistramenti TaxID=2884812 RepID=UPI001D088776|nr:iron ABC transporter permease [Streptomyces pinistramenti]MCB5906189.1 iron ABC transporter permease [Streptomyces pinistramenti]
MRVPRRTLVLAGLAAATALEFVLVLMLGPYRVPAGDVLRVLFGEDPADPRWTVIVQEVRLPRALTAVAAGAGISAAGVQTQALFRNPLADPYALGLSSGASLGVAATVLGAGGTAGAFTENLAGAGRVGVVLAAACGAAAVLLLVMLLARRVRSTVVLLLVGVMLGSAVAAFVSVLMVYAQPENAQQFVLWSLGSFTATTWADLHVMLPATALGLLAALLGTKTLNAHLLGDGYARSMGVNVRRSRDMVLLGTSLLAGSVTAFCGPVAFLGLAVPHLTRLALGTSDHRVLVPGAMIGGACLALTCALISQPPGTEVTFPINAVTSLFGAPLVIVLLLRRRRALRSMIS